MLRSILGVVVGFIAAALVVSAGFAAGVFGPGLNWILEPGAYDATTTWSLISVTIGLAGAIVGGLVCALIARRSFAPKVLAALLLLLGLAGAGISLMADRPDPGPRPADEAMADTLAKLEEPTWVAVTNSIAGFAGVLVGSSLVRRKKA